MADRLVYLKLGGSLITDKRRPETLRQDVLHRLAQEIAAVRRADPDLQLVLGHGSGSFGHVVGQRHGTRNGVHTSEEWFGFAATGDAAARLNRFVTESLLTVGVPAWSIQPSVVLRCQDGRIVDGPRAVVELALRQGLVPLLYGDVSFDSQRGGTIVSTEELFEWLSWALPPRRIVLAGEVDGVYTGDPLRNPTARLLSRVTPATHAALQDQLGDSIGTDVTGGMAAKVARAVSMVEYQPDLQVVICSGLAPGVLTDALLNTETAPGTLVCSTG